MEKAEERRVQAERRVNMTVEEIKEDKARAKAEKTKKKGASEKGVQLSKKYVYGIFNSKQNATQEWHGETSAAPSHPHTLTPYDPTRPTKKQSN